jgi:hypothetical protein
MAAIDEGRVALPNGAEIERDDRETGRVYVVYGDPAVRDALPSVTTVLKVIPAERLENWKLSVGVDELTEKLRGEFQQRYITKPSAPPRSSKVFTSLYTQAREWARIGANREDIARACGEINGHYVSPLNDDMLNRMIEQAVSLGVSEKYADYSGQRMTELAKTAKTGENRINTEAKNAGNKVHEYIEKELLGEPLPEVDSSITKALECVAKKVSLARKFNPASLSLLFFR